jgi:hypothetical protein
VGTPSVVRPNLRKNYSASSLKSLKTRNLSISHMEETPDHSPGTPLSTQFGSRLPAMPSLPPGLVKDRTHSATTSGLHLFENHFHSPDDLGSPNPLHPDDAPAPLEPCPSEVTLRPFWLMRALYQTLCHPRGGYVSTKLFVPRDVWRVKGVKLKGIEDKIANCDLLTAALQKLGRFAAVEATAASGAPLFVARTGYTGEDGFEILVAQDQVVAFWNALASAGGRPAGLGARDTLRLEAGMNLYGQDMDEAISPFEAALAWTVALDEGRDFIGRDVLEAQKAAGDARQMIGLVMDEKGVLRHGQVVLTASGSGEILSGTFSPTLGKGIAFARVPAGELGQVHVDIRGRQVPVRVVKFPFVREGQAQPGVLGDG